MAKWGSTSAIHGFKYTTFLLNSIYPQELLQQIKIRLNVAYDIDRIYKLHYNKNKT